MHGLALRAVQLFVTECYGADSWARVIDHAKFEFDEFEAMLVYPHDYAETVLSSAAHVLSRSRCEILEDIGTYLASQNSTERLRRLLRFGGVSFVDFLHSLDEMPDRARLAVPDLDMPTIELREHTSLTFSLTCQGNIPGFGRVLVGLLRTMADDYGALATVEYRGQGQGFETLQVTLLENTYSEGRHFDLGAHVA